MQKKAYMNLVSVITPTFNSENFLDETYKSLKNQIYTNWEWVVTDDCSNDHTLHFLEKISKLDSRVRIFSLKKNSGAALARNNSISKARGRFLAFLDADDLWEKNKLQLQIEFMNSNQLAFTYTSYFIVCENGEKTQKIIDKKSRPKLNYEDLLRKQSTVGCSTVILDQQLLGEVRMPNIRTGQDYATWLSILKKGESAYHFPKPLTRYRLVSNSLSANKIAKAKRQWEIYRTIEKLSLMKSVYCFLFYSLRAIFR